MMTSPEGLSEDVLTRQKEDVSEDEISFGFDEIFFSRTDEKGIIRAGNSVFQRVSVYEWDELLRRPHNLIRHPDMPKAVFWLLWDAIKKGLPVGAYVKNRAKDGRYYWVFAIITPIENGFLSVRIKPSSQFFDVVKQEYASLRALEKDRKLKAEESAKILLSRLNELNFEDYRAFASAALSQEIAARDIHAGREEDGIIANFNRLTDMSEDLFVRIQEMQRKYVESKYIPLNLRAQAARLGNMGDPIGIIANNYASISANAKDSMDLIMDFGQQVAKIIRDGFFLVGIARIQEEVSESFKRDAPNDGAIREQEIQRLEQQQATYSTRAVDGLKTISSRFSAFQEACAGMRRLTLGLEITCMMGRIESARLREIDEGLNSLIGGLGEYQDKLLSDLKEINCINQNIKSVIDQLLNEDMGVPDPMKMSL
jgi:aerotaxis receptor